MGKHSLQNIRYLALSLGLLLSGCTAPIRTSDPGWGARSLGVWSYVDLAGGPQRADFFAFAREQGIGEVYLNLSSQSGGLGRPLQDLLAEASRHGVRVALLMGRSGWSEPGKAGQAVAAAREVMAFVRRVRAEGGVLPSSLHLDVEPHALDSWSVNWPTLGTGYLEMLQAVRAELGGELPLVIDMPVWWDDRQVRFQGRTVALAEAAIGLADGVVLMDYRVRVSQILSSAAGELEVGRRLGKPVILGLACHLAEGEENRQTSFAQSGLPAMTAAMGEVGKALAQEEAYRGLAVFTYEDWRLLATPMPTPTATPTPAARPQP